VKRGSVGLGTEPPTPAEVGADPDNGAAPSRLIARRFGTSRRLPAMLDRFPPGSSNAIANRDERGTATGARACTTNGVELTSRDGGIE
jgi:hypothetical protein